MMPRLRFATLALCSVLALASCTKSSVPTGNGSSEYVLDVRWLGEQPAPEYVQVFDAAAAIVRQTIAGGLQSVTLPGDFNNLSQCDASLTGFPDVEDTTAAGLIMYVRVVPIDGIGGTLGSAGPCIVRGASQNFLPALGVMRLDEADVANLYAGGYLLAVVLHEMFHVLGFGTIWEDNDLLIGALSDNSRFVGPLARAACVNVNGGSAVCQSNVPVHSTGGTGSRDTHWRETVFTNELMTPFLTPGANPLSVMSIQSLADLGYEVSNQAAQPFTVSGSLLQDDVAAQSPPVVEFSEPLRARFVIGAPRGQSQLRRE